jgi:hypothetical protein
VSWLPMARTFRQQRHLCDGKDRESNERRWWLLAVCGVPARDLEGLGKVMLGWVGLKMTS